MLDAHALTEGVVRLHFRGKLALRIDREGESHAVFLGEFLSELGQNIRVGNGYLVGENGVAVVIAQLFAFGVEPARVDCGVEAPGVERQREIMADPRNVVLGSGLFKERVGAGAVRAFHVFPFDDGHPGAGGRLEDGWVVDLGSGRRNIELGAGGWNEDEQGRGYRKRGIDGGRAKSTGKGTKHVVWTAPYWRL